MLWRDLTHPSNTSLALLTDMAEALRLAAAEESEQCVQLNFACFGLAFNRLQVSRLILASVKLWFGLSLTEARRAASTTAIHYMPDDAAQPK